MSLVKHLAKHKKVLMTKLDRATDNNDAVMIELTQRLIDQQTKAIQECIDIIKNENDGQWRSLVCKK